MTKDYSKGRIYRIDGGGLTYVGSTVSPLSVRMATHRSQAKADGGCTSKKILCFTDAEITLVEMYPCDSQEELNKRERYWYDLIPCVNKNRPWLSSDEKASQSVDYYLANADKRKAYQTAYNNANADKYKAYQVTYQAANTDKIKAYRVANADKKKIYNAAYKAANADKIKAHQAANYAAKKLKKVEAEVVPEVPASNDCIE